MSASHCSPSIPVDPMDQTRVSNTQAFGYELGSNALNIHILCGCFKLWRMFGLKANWHNDNCL